MLITIVKVVFNGNQQSQPCQMLKALLEVTFLLRTVTWLIVMFVCLDMSRCFRNRVEEHRDVRIFFNKELKRYSISTSFLEFDLSRVDCFCHSVPYLGYWLVGNCFKPGDILSGNMILENILLWLFVCYLFYFIRIGPTTFRIFCWEKFWDGRNLESKESSSSFQEFVLILHCC